MAQSSALSYSNAPISPTIIAKEALMLLSNNMIMGRLVHKEYKNEFKKVGSSINLRTPVRFSAAEAQFISINTVTEYKETFTVATQVHVAWAFDTQELTTTIDEYSKRYITPAVLALANHVDAALCSLYAGVSNVAGTPGMTPNSYSDLGDAQTKLDDMGAPTAGRVAVLNPAAHWAMADGLKGTFASKPANDIHTKGFLGSVANLDMHMDQNIQRHLTGAFTTSCTPLINDAGIASGDIFIATDGWLASSADINAGDVFTVGNSSTTYVYSVNPVSGDSTGVLKQFVVLNDETSDASGEIVIDLYTTNSAGCCSSGAYKNQTPIHASGSTINMLGTESTYYPQNLIFHPNAFGLVTLPLVMPAGTWGSRVTDKQTALSIRVVKDYDITYDEEVIRLDILYGVNNLHPDLSCRLTG